MGGGGPRGGGARGWVRWDAALAGVGDWGLPGLGGREAVRSSSGLGPPVRSLVALAGGGYSSGGKWPLVALNAAILRALTGRKEAHGDSLGVFPKGRAVTLQHREFC